MPMIISTKYYFFAWSITCISNKLISHEYQGDKITNSWIKSYHRVRVERIWFTDWVVTPCHQERVSLTHWRLLDRTPIRKYCRLHKRSTEDQDVPRKRLVTERCFYCKRKRDYKDIRDHVVRKVNYRPIEELELSHNFHFRRAKEIRMSSNPYNMSSRFVAISFHRMQQRLC